MITLVKAQVFINIIGGFAFRSILKSFQINTAVRYLSVLVFCISYSFFNFWPWYNHSVIVFELLGIAFLLKFIFAERKTGTQFLWLLPAAFFVCFSFLTKQDGGGMAIGISILLLVHKCLLERNGLPVLLFVIAIAGIFLLLTFPFFSYGFGYWFNHGQAPHTARISLSEIADEFFSSSQWIKFYLFLFILVIAFRLTKEKNLVFLYFNLKEGQFLLLSLYMLAEAAVFQVTSYTPPDNNIFFHSFAFAYLANFLSSRSELVFEKRRLFICTILGIMCWWSGVYWKYIQRISSKILPADVAAASNPSGENIVNRHTYILNQDTSGIPMSDWIQNDIPVFKKISMPRPTVEGMNRLFRLDIIKSKKKLRVLNMSELTPLAAAIPFELERNPELPLWYHLGVGMFNKQAEIFERRIDQRYYDVVLFENIPSLNNFYPFRVRSRLLADYRLIDSFPAPRRGEIQGTIEVFVRE